MADNNKFAQAPKLYLSGSGVSSTATSVTVTSLKKPGTTTNITTTDIGAMAYATFGPGTSREENISFTTITQNADGTATLTGVTRGLDFVSPYAETSALKHAHAGGTELVISNSAPFYNELAAKDNDETITGTWTFTSSALPQLSSYAAPTDNAQLAAKKYVDDVAAGGTASINRVVVAATAGAVISTGNLVYFDATDNEWKLCDADTASTVDNVLLGIAQGAGTDGVAIAGGVLLAGLDANQSGMTQGDTMYASNTAGAIASSAGTTEVTVGIARSATDLYFAPRFDQQITESIQDALVGTAGTPSESNKYVTNDDVSDAGVASKVVRYDANSQIDVATTPTDSTHAASKSYVDTVSGEKENFSLSDVTVSNTVTETNLMSESIAGGTLSTANALEFWIPITDLDFISAHFATFRLKYGATTVASCTITNSTGGNITNMVGYIHGFLYANGATNAQHGTIMVNVMGDGVLKDAALDDLTTGNVGVGTATEDSTGALNLICSVQFNNANPATQITIPEYVVLKIR